MAKWHESNSLKMKFVFLIAGNELYKWKSKHNKIAGKMLESYTEQRIVKLLWEQSDCGNGKPCTEGWFGGICYCDAIALIKEENK